LETYFNSVEQNTATKSVFADGKAGRKSNRQQVACTAESPVRWAQPVIMKSSILFLFSLSVLLCCQQTTKTLSQAKDKTQSIFVDSTYRDSVKRQIQFTSDRYSSQFKTPIEARFFSNGLQTDSIVENNFGMISWYSIHKGTIDLVAHVGKFETEALLIRFLNGKPTVLFFRAPHDVEGSKYFKVEKADTFSHKIEIIPIHFQLKLSEFPDSTNKQVVFGHINLESGEYYDKRDTVEQRHKVQMKFYFRSQYRKFNY
jgi:hypothetical protein